VERHLPEAKGVLVLYHANQHLYETAVVLHGEGTPITNGWVQARRAVLLRGGAIRLGNPFARKRVRLDALTDYFRPHLTHTNYCERLWFGRRRLQNSDWSSSETDRRSLASSSRRAHGQPLLPPLWRSVECILVNQGSLISTKGYCLVTLDQPVLWLVP
jgi:hypothetical protein